MRIISTKSAGLLRIALEGELDHHAARNANVRIGQLVDIELPHKTVLNLSGLGFMDSSGIAVIINLYRRMQELGASLTIEEVPTQAYKVLNAAGINRIIPMEKAGATTARK